MIRLSQSLIAPLAIALGAGLCVLAALGAVGLLESRTGAAVRAALDEAGIDWAEAAPDGMLIRLSGTAPDEAARFRALSAVGAVIDAAHVVDEVGVETPNPLAAPAFSVELLRNASGLSVIGLVPAATDRGALSRDLARIAERRSVADMLESADHPVPPGWQQALDLGLVALARFDSAKVSISPGRVDVTAIAESARARDLAAQDLRKAVPAGVTLVLDISAPRPMIAPFTLRVLMDDDGTRFDACAADTEEARARIEAAARRAGLVGAFDCPLGLGVPAPTWGEAVAHGIDALAAAGGGTLTFSDSDVRLVAAPGSDGAAFDAAAAELRAALPAPFELHAKRADPATAAAGAAADGPRDFVATLSPEGLVQLRGRVPDALVQAAAESYARARFGQDRVHSALRLDPALPEGWPLRVLAGLEALSQLRNGSVVVQAGVVQVAGLTMDDTAQARVTRLLSDRLGDAQDFEIDITYRAPPAVSDDRPTPEACVAAIADILAQDKITFAPGATTIEGAAVRVIDRIAEVLRGCPDARIEIGGHTDSQGREEMNESLSRQRAEAVLTALMSRRVLTSNLTARGYGESRPIGDNDTEEGREANRRIEFRLIAPEREDAGDGGDADDTDGGTDGQD